MSIVRAPASVLGGRRAGVPADLGQRILTGHPRHQAGKEMAEDNHVEEKVGDPGAERSSGRTGEPSESRSGSGEPCHQAKAPQASPEQSEQ